MTPPTADGNGCDDGDPLTKDDVCMAQSCAGVPLCTGVVCGPPDQCHHTGVCNPNTGVCSNPLRPNGTACDDGNALTKDDACTAGVCGGVPLCTDVVCAPLDGCHDAGTCDPNTGLCSNPAKPDGTACDDGSPLTKDDVCTAGVCAGVLLCNGVMCAPSDACNDAACDPNTGACTTTAKPDGTPCDDGDGLTKNDVCTAGTCAGAPLCSDVTCVALDDCHDAGTCDPATGQCDNPVKADGAACDDGNACTQADTCQAGVCVGADGKSCAAIDDCHLDGACDPATGECSAPAKDNGASCAGGTCQDGSCVGGGAGGNGGAGGSGGSGGQGGAADVTSTGSGQPHEAASGGCGCRVGGEPEDGGGVPRALAGLVIAALVTSRRRRDARAA